MRFVLTCIGVCLLSLSGCVTPSHGGQGGSYSGSWLDGVLAGDVVGDDVVDSTTDTPPVVLKVLTTTADRTGEKVAAIDNTVDAIGHAVKIQRFERLNAYALQYNWVVTQPPEYALTHPEVMGWWKEWCLLKQELEGVRE